MRLMPPAYVKQAEDLLRQCRNCFNLPPRYNIAPSMTIDVIIPRGGDALS